MPYTFNISGLHDLGFLGLQFSSNYYFCVRCPLALKIHNVIEKMLKECCVRFSVDQFWNYASCRAIFLDYSIFKCIYTYLRNFKGVLNAERKDQRTHKPTMNLWIKKLQSMTKESPKLWHTIQTHTIRFYAYACSLYNYCDGRDSKHM